MRNDCAEARAEGIEGFDLRSHLRFAAGAGQIWLDEHRMLLVHASAMSSLRKELIDTLGSERARGVITRLGFASGASDAELVRRVLPGESDTDALLAGTALHTLEGIVKVTPVKVRIDISAGSFEGEFLWQNSFEAEGHLQAFGVETHPVCWMQLGYACGYTSTLMGQFILYREVKCAGKGDPHCRIVGKPVSEWEDCGDDLAYYQPDSVAEQILELQREVTHLRSSIREELHPTDIVGASDVFQDSLDLVRKAADSRVSVLLLGETGVGKEMFAQALHGWSKRSAAPFVAVNCAAIPEELLESELFGVEKGAYSGANQSRPGRFERAHRGTLFLDELGELSPAAQAKLLRVVEQGVVERVGDTRTRNVDVRIVAATNADLQEAVEDGRFRSDLYFRMNVYPVTIPPLRDRKEDIPLLVQRFVEQQSVRHGKRVLGATDRAMEALIHYAWPGNVRELENVIERGVILAESGSRIELRHLFPDVLSLIHISEPTRLQ
mgnify:CR=1 FL=1